mmetsp:Transcript_29973/g.65886  ORF Transcript_29973/g.65886 Transcript_29973/m.65886 type:complete len:270 (+) Transcript_29973:1117-1926(+)
MLDNRRQRPPVALDIRPVPPGVAPRIHHSSKRLAGLVIPQIRRPGAGVGDVPLRRLQRRAHSRVSGDKPGLVVIAPVELEVVHPPGGVGVCVLLLEALGPRVPPAGLGPFVAVGAEEDALVVQVVPDGLHALGEPGGVRDHGVVDSPGDVGPAIIDGHLVVPRVEIPIRGNVVSHLLVQLVVDAAVWVVLTVRLASEDLPGHPTHGRRLGQAVGARPRGRGVRGGGAEDGLGPLVLAAGAVVVGGGHPGEKQRYAHGWVSLETLLCTNS